MSCSCRCLNCITPPHLLQKLLESKDKDVREAALNTMLATAQLRGERAVPVRARVRRRGPHRRPPHRLRLRDPHLAALGRPRPHGGRPGLGGRVGEPRVRGFGATREFYREVFDRDSIDDHGMRLDGYVHRGMKYNNAFWDGQEMVFGDGDGGCSRTSPSRST